MDPINDVPSAYANFQNRLSGNSLRNFTNSSINNIRTASTNTTSYLRLVDEEYNYLFSIVVVMCLIVIIIIIISSTMTVGMKTLGVFVSVVAAVFASIVLYLKIPMAEITRM